MPTYEELYKLRIIKTRLKGLINSTVKQKISLKEGVNWAYDIKNKRITYPIEGKQGIKQLPSEVFIGTLLHEVGHAKYSIGLENIMDTLPEPKKEYSLLLNSLEDIRIEKKLINRFPGTYDNLKNIQDYVAPHYTEEVLKKMPPHINVLINVIRDFWEYNLCFTNKKAEKFFKDNYSLIQKVGNLKTAKQLHKFIQDELWEKFLKLLPPPQKNKENKKNKKNKSKKNENEKSKKNETKKDENKKNENKKDEINNEDDGGDKDNESDKNNEKSNEDKIDQAQSIGAINQILQENTKTNSTSKESLLERLNIEPDKLKDDRNYTNQTRPEAPIGNYRSCRQSYESLYEDVKQFIGYFSRKLNSILVDNNLKRFGGAFKRGKLDTKLLYKWKCNNTRLFNKPILRLHKEYSVCLLVDESSSMRWGDKHIKTAKAVVLLSEVLSKVNIPFEICGFNNSNRIYKKYDKSFTWKIKRNIELIIPNTSGGTNDAYSINWANYRLQQREGEKIMIVLTDGEPNPSYSQIPLEDQKRLPKVYQKYSDFKLRVEIRKVQQNSTIIGIGLNDDYVRKYYKQNVVCKEVGDLPKILLRVLQKQIKRG